MFEFAETTKDMTAKEILNYYRNLYYAEPQVTERGIVANAINDVLVDVAPRAEVERLLEDFQRSIRADAKVGMSAGEILLHISNMLVELKKKYTEVKQ